jgi:flagellar protein FliJ
VRRFQFRLEKFRELKRHAERQRELELARVLGQCLLLKKRIEEISGEVAASYSLSFRSGGRIDVVSMAGRELYVQRLTRERTVKEEELAVRTVELEEVRGRYLQAAKERKVLDKLRERAEKDYYERQRDEEFKVMDDLNTAATLRQHW